MSSTTGSDSEITESQEFKSKLFVVNEYIDPVDEMDRQWSRKHKEINLIIQNLTENELVTKLQSHIGEKVENYTETFSALIYSYLTVENSPIFVFSHF
jgi:hypothetical protein